MIPFRYRRGHTAEQAVQAGAVPYTSFLAGGTTLVDLMKLEVERPSAVIDINALPLAAIEPLPNGGVRIGALARNSDVAHHALIRTAFPALRRHSFRGASPQLRNMATVGGNIMQRTRCYYFRDTAYPCNKRQPGSGCPAILGFNRSNAILGGSDHCIATNPSDMNVALAALNATVHVQGASGTRAIAFEDFHLPPGITPDRETSLDQGELILSVDLPASPASVASMYMKVRDRASYEFALVSVALAIHMESGRATNVRVAFGGVATRPWRAFDVEKVLEREALTEDVIERAAVAAIRFAEPRRDNAFKVDLLFQTVIRALRTFRDHHDTGAAA